jgi:hypothetical protein
LCVQGAGRYSPKNAYSRKQIVTNGMIQPVVRRIASSTSSDRATPNTMSQSFGTMERSKKPSPPTIR